MEHPFWAQSSECWVFSFLTFGFFLLFTFFFFLLESYSDLTLKHLWGDQWPSNVLKVKERKNWYYHLTVFNQLKKKNHECSRNTFNLSLKRKNGKDDVTLKLSRKGFLFPSVPVSIFCKIVQHVYSWLEVPRIYALQFYLRKQSSVLSIWVISFQYMWNITFCKFLYCWTWLFWWNLSEWPISGVCSFYVAYTVHVWYVCSE